MQVKELFSKYKELQSIYWDTNLDPVYWCGNINRPKLCLVFMNPTARNVSVNKSWTWLKAPWIGTKNVWNMFYHLWFIDKNFIEEINSKKPNDWDYWFSEEVYKKISKNNIYITNLSKASQIDARPLSNDVFRKYLDLFKTEIDIIKPEKIITFWNQVSSVLLDKNIKVSEYRKRYELLDINWVSYKVFPVYYPVWQWMRNMSIAREDIDWIMKS